MSRNIDIDKFLMNDENLIDAELLCNEIDNFIDSYFKSKDLMFSFVDDRDDRYVYLCPPKKNGGSYIFEIGFGHDEAREGFSEDEQKNFKEKLKRIMEKYSWKQHAGLIVNETWVCGKFDYNKKMTMENLKKFAEEVKNAFGKMKA